MLIKTGQVSYRRICSNWLNDLQNMPGTRVPDSKKNIIYMTKSLIVFFAIRLLFFLKIKKSKEVTCRVIIARQGTITR